MKSVEKTLKIKTAIENAIVAKNGTTNILFHLQKEFPEHKNIQKLFKEIFNENPLIEVKLLEVKTSYDKRKKEYHLTALNQIYKQLVEICKQVSNNFDCNYLIKNLIVNELMEKIFNGIESDLLENLRKEIKNKLFKTSPKREMEYGFISASPFKLDTTEIFLNVFFESITKEINVEKLNKEINVLKNLFLII
jgi:hypothetical protein